MDIEFIAGDANVPPLNPEDPNIPGNGGTDESGSLALNFVSSLAFGEQEISAYEEEYPTITQQPYIQVTDLRGTNAGWAVNAKVSNFLNIEKGTPSLLGATITLKDTSFNTPTTGILPPTPVDPAILPTDSSTAVRVVRAEASTGMGTWLTRWYTDPDADENYSVILTVPPGAATLGENTATITWMLMDVPI